jgi:hypothetical protein
MPTPCKHHRPTEHKKIGLCVLGLHGGLPSIGTCAVCTENTSNDWPGKEFGRPLTPEHMELAEMIQAHHQDPLLGDRIEAWAKRVGADKAAKAWEEWTKLPCGCEWRREMLNKLDQGWRAIRAKLWG